MKKTISIALSLLLLLANFSTIVRADEAEPQATVELRGTVIDETNAYIPAAPITLDDGKGNKYSGQTDERGRYHLNVKPGLYTVTVEVEGFAKFVEQVDLTQKRKEPFDVKLKVGLSEQVEVQDNATGISTEPDKNLSSITIGEKELEALPDDPDELLQTLKQMAGAAGGADDAAVYVGGFRERGQLPPKEAIQRININLNPFSAEYSEPGSSRIEIITKPGADTFHGGFNFNFGDDALSARDPFASSKAPFQIRRYGGYLNGPIIRNRMGFSADFQRREEDDSGIINAIVLNPVTFLPEPFSTVVLNPIRSTNFSIRTDFLATKKHTLGLQYRRSESENINRGGQFTLPDRASSNKNSEDTLRFSLTTIASERAVNEMRIQLSRSNRNGRGLVDGVAINVIDSFNGGGSQTFTDALNRNLDFTDSLTYTHKTHTFKAGFRAEAVQLKNINRSNFIGSFTFSGDFERDANGEIILDGEGAPTPITSIELYSRVVRGVPGYRPSQFTINRGEPFIGFSQWEFGYFAQDDWKISQRLTLSYGFRHEFQTHLQDKLNIAPRFSVAWNPDQARKSTIRGGGGIFYNRLDTGITSETIRLDGFHQQQFVIQQPDFFLNIPDNLSLVSTRLPTIRIKAEDLNAPYTIMGTASYERQLSKNLFGSATYSFTRGVHLLRTRNINAPLAVVDDRPVLPFPGEGPILQYESTGISTRNQFSFNLRSNISRTFSLFGGYTLAYTNSDTDGSGTNPANPYDLSTEYGRASGDIRHNLYAVVSATVPWGFRITSMINASSGRPFNIITGRDNNGDNQFSDRPAFAQPGDPGAIVTPFGIFNPDPQPGDIIIPRNFGQGPAFFNVNLNISKTIGFGPAPNNFPRMAASQGAQPDTQNQSQGNQRGQNQRGGNNNRRGGTRGGGGGGGNFGGGQVMMRGGGGGGPIMMGGFGGDNRHKYSLTFGINIANVFNHPNLGQFSGSLTSPFFGRANSLTRFGGFGGFGGGTRRIEANMRFNF